MTLKKQLHAFVWGFIPSVVTWLIDSRDATNESLTEYVIAGINYSIILNSACFVEGALEAGLKAILRNKSKVFHDLEKPIFETRKYLNQHMNRMHGDLNHRIERTTGAENYNRMFELIVGYQLSDLEQVKPLWEGVRVLFHFRNMIAHGREIFTELTFISSHYENEIWREEFSGGYSKVEEYLLKKSLIDVKFCDQDSGWLFFQNQIADHFWDLAQSFLDAVVDSLVGIDKRTFESALNLQSEEPNIE